MDKKYFEFFIYKQAEMKNHYPCKAVAQKTLAPGKTAILYTILGKRDLYEISIQDLMDDPELINKFSPTQATKFGVIALSDMLASIPESERATKLNKVRDTLMPEEQHYV